MTGRNQLLKDRIKSKSKEVPGSLIYTGTSTLDTKIMQYDYGEDFFEIAKTIDFSNEYNNWISVEGFHNQEEIIKLAEKVNVSTFFVEDIFNVSQRNKYEIGEGLLFVVMKYPNIEKDQLSFRYLSIVVKESLIMTFSDHRDVYSENLLRRVKLNKAVFVNKEVSYLLYALYDMIIDDQLEIVKELNYLLNDYESRILDPDKHMGTNLYQAHKKLVKLRNNAKSLNDNLSPKDLAETTFFNKDTKGYLNDLEDHVMNLYEKTNMTIEVCNSLITMYSNQISNKTNDVMKMLTVISVIFIPLSFFAGVFGMNFIHFSILDYRYGIELFFAISFIIVLGMLGWFKYKDWL